MSSFSEKGLLGELEQLVLLGVMHLEGAAGGTEAHAPAIREAIETRTGIALARGSIYVTLDRLDRKGYLRSRFGEPTAERGGKAKRLFTLTAAGRRALSETERALALTRAAPARTR